MEESHRKNVRSSVEYVCGLLQDLGLGLGLGSGPGSGSGSEYGLRSGSGSGSASRAGSDLGSGSDLGRESASRSELGLELAPDSGLGSVSTPGFLLPLSAEHIRRSKFNDPRCSPALLHVLHHLIASSVSKTSAVGAHPNRNKKKKKKNEQVRLLVSSDLAFHARGDGIRSFKKLMYEGEEEEFENGSCRNPISTEGNSSVKEEENPNVNDRYHNAKEKGPNAQYGFHRNLHRLNVKDGKCRNLCVCSNPTSEQIFHRENTSVNRNPDDSDAVFLTLGKIPFEKGNAIYRNPNFNGLFHHTLQQIPSSGSNNVKTKPKFGGSLEEKPSGKNVNVNVNPNSDRTCHTAGKNPSRKPCIVNRNPNSDGFFHTFQQNPSGQNGNVTRKLHSDVQKLQSHRNGNANGKPNSDQMCDDEPVHVTNVRRDQPSSSQAFPSKSNLLDRSSPLECEPNEGSFNDDASELITQKLEFVKFYLHRWGYPKYAPIFSLTKDALQSRPMLLAIAWFLWYFDLFETILLHRIGPLMQLLLKAPLPPYPRDVSTSSKIIKLGREAEGDVRAMVNEVLQSLDSVEDVKKRTVARAQQALIMYGKVKHCMKSLRSLKLSKEKLVRELKNVQIESKVGWHKRPLTQYEVSLLQHPDALISHFNSFQSDKIMREKIDESHRHEALFQEWMESVLEMSISDGISDGWIINDNEFNDHIICQLLPGKPPPPPPQQRASLYRNIKNKSVSSKEVELLLKDIDMNELGLCIKSINDTLSVTVDKQTTDADAEMIQRVKKLPIILHQILASTCNISALHGILESLIENGMLNLNGLEKLIFH